MTDPKEVEEALEWFKNGGGGDRSDKDCDYGHILAKALCESRAKVKKYVDLISSSGHGLLERAEKAEATLEQAKNGIVDCRTHGEGKDVVCAECLEKAEAENKRLREALGRTLSFLGRVTTEHNGNFDFIRKALSQGGGDE